MGEVYEALDSELREHVAIKVLRLDLASDAQAVSQFRREAHLARQVTHPGICRIHDVFHGSHAGREFVFVTMQLLRGESLSQKLRRQILSVDEALPIARDIADGLDAAHAEGVIHRDLKSGNVMLVPDRAGRIRGVITDFGLADRPAVLDDESTTTRADLKAFVGTPAYMSPEQVAGRPVTILSDIYSFGVVLFEMVTGKLPFSGDTPIATAAKRLSEPPPTPRQHVPTLAPAWESTILRCLTVDPAGRFPTARAVVDALAGAAPVLEARRRPVHVAAIVGLAAILVAVGLGIVAQRWLGRGSEAGKAGGRPSVAVMGFRDLSGRQDTAWLATALAEMLAVELSAAERIRTIPGETVQRARADLDLGGIDTYDTATLGRLRQRLGSDYVLVGTFLAPSDSRPAKLRVDMRLQDARNGQTVVAFSESGPERDLAEIVSKAGGTLRARLGAPERGQSSATRLAVPATTDAARLYVAGLEHLRQFDALAARSLLEKAISAEPNHALAHFALSEALTMLGYDDLAHASAVRAAQLAEGLSREQRFLIDGRVSETSRQWSQAVRAYRSLFAVFPESVEYGIRLADTQVSAGQPREAMQTVTALRALPDVGRNDPRIDLAEASAAESEADFRRMRFAASAAAAKARNLGALLLLARARVAEAWALKNLGQRAEAKAANEEARELYLFAGDQRGVCRTLVQRGSLLREEGRLDEAEAVYQEAIGITRTIGNQRTAAQALNNLGNVYYEQGRLDRAGRAYDEALEASRLVRDLNVTAYALNNLASVLYESGDIAGALKYDREALEIRRELGDRKGLALSFLNLAEVYLEQGRPREAEAHNRDAVEGFRSAGALGDEGFALIQLAQALVHGGQFAAAQEQLSRAAAVYSQVSDAQGLAETKVAHAELALAMGDALQARQRAQSVTDEVEATGDDELSARCRAALVRAQVRLRQQGQETELATLPEVESRQWTRATRSALAAAKWELAASGRPSDVVVRQASAAAAEMRKLGLLRYAIEYDIVVAQLRRARGQNREAETKLRRAADEARRLGLIALERLAINSL